MTDFADAAWPARHDDNLVAEHQRLIDAVCHEYDRAAALLPDRDQLFLHFELGLRVERCKRLVHQDDAWVHQQARAIPTRWFMRTDVSAG